MGYVNYEKYINFLFLNATMSLIWKKWELVVIWLNLYCDTEIEKKSVWAVYITDAITKGRNI